MKCGGHFIGSMARIKARRGLLETGLLSLQPSRTLSMKQLKAEWIINRTRWDQQALHQGLQTNQDFYTHRSAITF